MQANDTATPENVEHVLLAAVGKIHLDDTHHHNINEVASLSEFEDGLVDLIDLQVAGIKQMSEQLIALV